MAYPSSYYYDPLKGALNREYGYLGCPVCLHREKRADGTFKCAAGSAEWPNGMRGSCKQWIRKTKNNAS